MKAAAAALMLTYETSLNGFRLISGRCWCFLMEPEPSPLEMIFTDIEKALDAQLYYVAIAVALSIPDICAALECDADKIWVNEKKYISWFEANLASEFAVFTAQDCYRLRCGVLHQGRFGHPKAQYDRILFTLPARITMHECLSRDNGGIKESALNLDAMTFCHQIIAGARRWLLKSANNPNVQANLPNVVRMRPYGMAPHIIGVPLIA